ncbi:MAG: hypothetical protein B7Z45_06125 [Azorhizobium sp. 12-66-6]|nr:MAG: hypothetical protein B7Z45_06125 [Azorhizobium sp. 12-66-6]
MIAKDHVSVEQHRSAGDVRSLLPPIGRWIVPLSILVSLAVLEEFAVLLPDTDGTGAFAIAEQIRGAAAGHRGEAGAPDLPPFTVSIGVACVQPSEHGAVEAFIDAADAALYRAKQAGRNCVVLAA